MGINGWTSVLKESSPKSAHDFHVNCNSQLPLARELYPRSPLSFKKLKHSTPQMTKYFHFENNFFYTLSARLKSFILRQILFYFLLN